jgi:hypothetical protein
MYISNGTLWINYTDFDLMSLAILLLIILGLLGQIYLIFRVVRQALRG